MDSDAFESVLCDRQRPGPRAPGGRRWRGRVLLRDMARRADGVRQRPRRIGHCSKQGMTVETQHHPHWIEPSREARARIEHALHVRSATPGTMAAKLEHVTKQAGTRLWIQMKKRPSLGVALTGITGLAVAIVVGAAELAIGIAAGYAAYQVLREGVAPREVARKVIEEITKLE